MVRSIQECHLHANHRDIPQLSLYLGFLLAPFSTAGMYCLGIAPPKILSTNANSFHRIMGAL